MSWMSEVLPVCGLYCRWLLCKPVQLKQMCSYCHHVLLLFPCVQLICLFRFWADRRAVGGIRFNISNDSAVTLRLNPGTQELPAERNKEKPVLRGRLTSCHIPVYSSFPRLIHCTWVYPVYHYPPFFGYYFFNMMLVVLLLLHIFWAYLILWMIRKFIFGTVSLFRCLSVYLVSSDVMSGPGEFMTMALQDHKYTSL